MRRKNSLRLPWYDYRSGCFLVTVISHRRMASLATLQGASVVPSDLGLHLVEAWECIQKSRPGVVTHAFQMMPDHWHAVVQLDGESGTLGDLVGSVKSRAARRARECGVLGKRQKLWHRGYHARWLPDSRAVRCAAVYVWNNPRVAAQRRAWFG